MTEENIIVNGNSYIWYNYDLPLDVLNASDVNNAQSNLNTLREIMISKGYNLEALTNVSAEFSTELIKVVEVLNGIEYNLDVLNNTDLKSAFYNQPVTAVAGEKAHDKVKIWRWFKVMNDILDMIRGIKGKWVFLLCQDGFPTIKSKKILVRSEING